MSRFFFFVSLCLSLVVLAACPKKAPLGPKRVVLNYAKNFKAWRTITKRRFPSQNHGNFVQEIFANGPAYRVSSGKQEGGYTEGSIFLMTLRNDEGVLEPNAYVMRKMASGYHEGYGDWRYSIVRLSDWTLDRDGKLADCIRCHFKSANRDFVPLMQKDGL